jgi:hypothetical protein
MYEFFLGDWRRIEPQSPRAAKNRRALGYKLF